MNPKTNNTTKSLNADTNCIQTNHKIHKSESDGGNTQQNKSNQQDDIDNLSALL